MSTLSAFLRIFSLSARLLLTRIQSLRLYTTALHLLQYHQRLRTFNMVEAIRSSSASSLDVSLDIEGKLFTVYAKIMIERDHSVCRLEYSTSSKKYRLFLSIEVEGKTQKTTTSKTGAWNEKLRLYVLVSCSSSQPSYLPLASERKIQRYILWSSESDDWERMISWVALRLS